MLGDIERLRAIINSGNAYCLVGGGASCEMGVPGWRALAEKVEEKTRKYTDKETQTWIQRKLKEENYPVVFQKAYEILGKERVIKFLKKTLRPTKTLGRIYQTISQWPFKVYLTTNFDGLLKRHLDQTGVFFSAKNNTESNIRTITDDAENIVVELHGSLSNPDTVVLTESQYQQILHSPSKEYLRRKIGNIFDLYSVIIIAYSLKDPDIRYFVEAAKVYSSPEKPFYMFLADAPEPEIATLYQNKNIRVIPYSTTNGGHEQLVEILQMIDAFIIPRQREQVTREKEDTDLATSLYLHTKMQLENQNREFGRDTYGILILNSLWKLPGNRSNSIDQTIEHFPLKSITKKNYDSNLFEEAVRALSAMGLVNETLEKEKVPVLFLTPDGIQKLEVSAIEFRNSEEQFEGQVALDYRSRFPAAAADEERSFVSLFKESLIRFFKQRGLALTSAILGRHSFAVATDKNVFKTFRAYASQLMKREEQVYFLSTAAKLLGSPSDIQRKYLSILSQRYFIYHALDLDPRCQTFRLDHLRATVWIMDSSIILPLIARNCENYSCAVDLFERIRDLQIPIFTTRGLFQEVINHANWVTGFIRRNPSDVEFLRACREEGEYRENLFLKGYINTAVEVGLKGFNNYFQEIFPANDYQAGVRSCLKKYGIRIVEFHEWPGFSRLDWGDLPDDATAITQKRQDLGTYKSDTQCRTEAVVVNILRNERTGRYDILSLKAPKEAYFISQSGVVNILKKRREKIFTWSPESFYRYLLTFPGSEEHLDSFYECMITGLSQGGLLVINEQRYAQYFSDLIQQSKLDMVKITEQYRDTLGEKQALQKSDWFQRTPDLQKPLFSHQLGLEIAEIERGRRMEAERRAAEAKRQKKLTDRDRIDLERYRSKAKLKRQRARAKRERKQKQKRKKPRR